MKGSYHNHTYRCKHASGTEEEYIKRAISAGYDEFGFADHCPHAFSGGGFICDSRMRADQLAEYVETISALREKYRDYIDIKIGLETEYLPYYHKANMDMFRAAGVEYLIIGQHLIGDNTPSVAFINSFARTQDNDVLTYYTDTVIAAMNTGNFCYLAHPDVLHYQGGDPDFYRQESDRLIRAAMDKNIPLEVNMYGLLEDRHYPNDLFWGRAGKLGATVVLGRDAHVPERVDPIDEYKKAYEFIEKHGLNLAEHVNVTKKL